MDVRLSVAPSHRRRGVGLTLTRHRLERLRRRRVEEVWFFASAANPVTIDLHERLGFEEFARDFANPGVTFTGGAGILFRKSLQPGSP
jgi:ribosomal protein S18 acetylase RimI-like enzyme